MQIHRNPETVAMIQKLHAQWLQDMKAAGKKIPVYTDMEDGLPEEFKGIPSILTVQLSDLPAPEVSTEPAAPRTGALKLTSKAEMAREVMRNTKGLPLDEVIQKIMDATGHNKALAKATYKANAARVGIVL